MKKQNNVVFIARPKWLREVNKINPISRHRRTMPQLQKTTANKSQQVASCLRLKSETPSGARNEYLKLNGKLEESFFDYDSQHGKTPNPASKISRRSRN